MAYTSDVFYSPVCYHNEETNKGKRGFSLFKKFVNYFWWKNNRSANFISVNVTNMCDPPGEMEWVT